MHESFTYMHLDCPYTVGVFFCSIISQIFGKVAAYESRLIIMSF